MSDLPKLMNRTDWGLLWLLSILWGGTFVFVEIAIEVLDPLTIAFSRVAIGALVLLPIFWMSGHQLPKSLSGWQPFLVMGLLNNVIPFTFLTAGQAYVSAGLASILNAMTPLCAVLVMAGFGEERLTWNRLAGVFLGVAGVAVLSGFGVGEVPLAGVILCLTGTMGYGFAALWGRRHLSGIPPLRSAACQLICSSVIMGILVLAIDQPWRLAMPGWPVWASLFGLGTISTALAYLLFFRILVSAGASNVMLVTLLIPISGVFLGWAVLAEEIQMEHILGAVVIGLGLLFIDGRWLRK